MAVTRLLAVLERLQHDMPPALAMRPDDALAAARGSMLIGASLPPVYAQAKAVATRIEALERTRKALEMQRKQAADTAANLTQAHAELDDLLTQKEQEAELGRPGLWRAEIPAGQGRAPGGRLPGPAHPGEVAAPGRRPV